MFWNFLIHAAGILTFLFLFWKRLKEDYSSEIIFTSAMFVLLFLGVGAVLSQKIFPGFWFWLTLLGSFFGLLLGARRFNMDMVESFEAFGISLLPYLSLIFFQNSVTTESLPSFIAFAVCLSLFGLYYYISGIYKNFLWYASGRVGFAGLFTFAIFFIIKAVAGLILPPGFVSSGRIETLLSGGLSFTLFFVIVNIAKTK